MTRIPLEWVAVVISLQSGVAPKSWSPSPMCQLVC
ncbi:hypothetical protein ACVWWG_000183 [Bradyrhizobium sp. LB7.2]